MRLAELQQVFWETVRSRRGPPANLDDTFESTSALSAEGRMRIYHMAYFARQVEVLKSVFPRTAEALGSSFALLARAYVGQHPSEDPRIERVGRQFASFLEERPDRAPRAVASLAALEWIRLEALVAPDPGTVMSPREVAPECFARMRFAFVPSVRSAVVDAEALALWGDAAGDATGARTVVAYRKEHVVRHVIANPLEAALFVRARSGADVASLCDFLAGSETDLALAYEVFRGWFTRGWIAALVPGAAKGEAR